MPDPTDAQQRKLASLVKSFGKDNVKGHAADANTGLMRVDAKCAAGQWVWYFDRVGEYRDGHLTARLFTPEPPKHVPRNAIDN
jgi:hypothetical protein